MGFMPEQVAELSAKLNPAHVAQRTQSGRSLSYIESWHAIAEANRIFGFGAWDRETLETKCVAERERKIGKPPYEKDGWGVSYVAKVRIRVVTPNDGVIERTGTGAGHGIDADLGLAHESAIKEAESDAMKRALMTFGNPFGLALYDKTQANVGSDEPPAKPARQTKAASAETIAVDVEQAAVSEAWQTWVKQSVNTANNWQDEEALRAWQDDERNRKNLAKLDNIAPELAASVRDAIATRADYLLTRFARAG